MRVLVACEESQAVCKAFRARGHEAYSCDIQPASGGHPEWHIEGDVLPLLAQYWDMVIAFPPCTDLAVSGARWFTQKRADGRQQASVEFFMQFVNCPCMRLAIENPVGIMSNLYRSPDQIIHPWQFGHPLEKPTCLWLRWLPPLASTDIVNVPERVTFDSGKSMPEWYANAWRLPSKDRAKLRSKTFHGIAQAMADQWGSYEY